MTREQKAARHDAAAIYWAGRGEVRKAIHHHRVAEALRRYTTAKRA